MYPQYRDQDEGILNPEFEAALYPEREWSSFVNTAKKYASPFYNWITGSSTPSGSSSRSKSVSEAGMVKNAIAGGNQNESALTDLVFYNRHPELGGKPLTTSMPNLSTLSKEWLTIRNTVVRPLLQSPASPIPTPSTGGSNPVSGPTTNWTTVPEDQRMLYIMEKLVNVYRLPVNGAAGLVGNLKAESGAIPNRIEGSSSATPMRAKNFQGVITDFSAAEIMNRNYTAKTGPLLPGAGLAQWTSSSRRSGLFKHTYNGRVLGAAILYDMDAQIDYLIYELKNSYSGVLSVISKSIVSLNSATDEVVYNFETPGSVLDPVTKTKLPRTDSRVQTVFSQRRKYGQLALTAYKSKHP